MRPSFTTVLNAASASEGRLDTSVPDEWTQGRTIFGGLQAALALRAMRSLVALDVPLRSLQGVLVAPVGAGSIEARAQVLRTGRSASQLTARLQNADQTLALFSAVFGATRESAVRVTPRQQPVPCDTPREFSFVPGLMPNFTQFFRGQWLRGGAPFTASPVPEAVIEVEMLDDAPFATEAHVLAIADFLPPVAISMLSEPVAVATMAWMFEFLPWGGDLPLKGWRLDAQLVAGADGYTSQSVMVWGPSGIPVALSRQSLAVFG